MKQVSIVFFVLLMLIAVRPAVTQETTPATATLASLAAPNPLAVQPASVSNATTTELVVTGTGFVDGAAVVIEGYGALATTFVSAQMLRAELRPAFPQGLYGPSSTPTPARRPCPTLTVTNPPATALPDVTATPEPTSTPQPTAFLRP